VTRTGLLRPLALVAALTAAATLLAGCGVFDTASAASVNGEGISDDDLQDELAAIRDNEQYRQSLEAGFGGSLLGQSDGTFNSVFAARVLTLQIYFELASQFLAGEGVEIGPDLVRAAREDATEQAGGPEIFGKFPKRYQDLVVQRRAIVVALDERLSREFRREGAVEAYFEEHRREFEQLCASHILVDSQDRAAELRSRIEGGADFASLARTESTDTASAQQGGDLGCQATGTFVPEFEEAAAGVEVGEVSEPVQTPFGFHLILVRERKVPTFEEVAGQVEQRLASLAQESFNKWLADAAADADVDVNPRYGTWKAREAEGAELFEVVPPEGPTTTGEGPAPTGVPQG